MKSLGLISPALESSGRQVARHTVRRVLCVEALQVDRKDFRTDAGVRSCVAADRGESENGDRSAEPTGRREVIT